jgi:hypothetical protein
VPPSYETGLNSFIAELPSGDYGLRWLGVFAHSLKRAHDIFFDPNTQRLLTTDVSLEESNACGRQC